MTNQNQVLSDKIGHDTGDILFSMQNEIHDFSLASDHVTVVMNDWNMTTYINLRFKEEIKTGEPALNFSKIAWAFTDVTIGWDKAKKADYQIGQIHKIHFKFAIFRRENLIAKVFCWKYIVWYT